MSHEYVELGGPPDCRALFRTELLLLRQSSSPDAHSNFQRSYRLPGGSPNKRQLGHVVALLGRRIQLDLKGENISCR